MMHLYKVAPSDDDIPPVTILAQSEGEAIAFMNRVTGTDRGDGWVVVLFAHNFSGSVISHEGD